MARKSIIILLGAMVSWDAVGHASQLVAGRDWSVDQPTWVQWLFCAVWFPSWTAYNGFWAAYWSTALFLLVVVARMRPNAASSPRSRDGLHRTRA
jgi:hypothetical protein